MSLRSLKNGGGGKIGGGGGVKRQHPPLLLCFFCSREGKAAAGIGKTLSMKEVWERT